MAVGRNRRHSANTDDFDSGCRMVCNRTLVRSNGCDTKVAAHDAAPPNQNGVGGRGLLFERRTLVVVLAAVERAHM